MTYRIDSRDLGTRDGFNIRAYIEGDDSINPEQEYDCYSPEDIASWKADEWQFVVVVVEASAAGVVLGTAYLGAVEYGDIAGTPVWDYWHSTCIDEHGMVQEAIDLARERIEELRKLGTGL